MYDLNDLVDSSDEWTLLEATGINSRGQICGHGLNGGKERAFLLTPKPALQTPAISVAILSPTNNATLPELSSVELSARAEAGVEIKRVTFLVAGEVAGTSANLPYTVKWKTPRAGDYDLFAVVTTVRGDTRKSPRIHVRIEPKK
jgi:hypothetical protein